VCLLDELPDPRDHELADVFRGEHQAGLTAEVVSEQHGMQLPASRLVEDGVGGQVELGDAVDHGPEHLGLGQHGHQGVLHAEGRAGVLEMRGPHHPQARVVGGRRKDGLPALLRLHVVARVRPGEGVDGGRVGLVLEVAGTGQRAFLVVADVPGEVERAGDVVRGRMMVRDVDGPDVVGQPALEALHVVGAEMGQEPRHGVAGRHAQPARRTVDGLPGQGGQEPLAVDHGMGFYIQRIRRSRSEGAPVGVRRGRGRAEGFRSASAGRRAGGCGGRSRGA
jgi:hypothetical protein